MIEDYETVEKPLGNRKGNPRYIYFIGKSNYMEEWLKKSGKDREEHENYLGEANQGDLFNYNDDDDNDNNMYATVDSDSISSPKERPLSLYWFIEEDDDENNNNVKKDDKNETKILQNKIQSMEREFSEKLYSMEENIKQLVTLLKDQRK